MGKENKGSGGFVWTILALIGVAAGVLLTNTTNFTNESTASDPNNLPPGTRNEYDVRVVRAEGITCYLEYKDSYLRTLTINEKVCEESLGQRGLAKISKSGGRLVFEGFVEMPQSKNEITADYIGNYLYYHDINNHILLGRIVREEGLNLKLDSKGYADPNEPIKQGDVGGTMIYNITELPKSRPFTKPNLIGLCAYGDLVGRVYRVAKCPLDYDPHIHSPFNDHNLAVMGK